MDTKKIINCPACGNILTKISADNVNVDVCQDGCGGTWFDNYELKRFDENFEKAGEILLNIRKKQDLQVNREEKRKCPVCPSSIMMKNFYSPKKEVKIDKCPTCGGVWLDSGELAKIRSQFSSEKERKEYTENFAKNLYSQILETEGKFS